jgi:hypothetical protein
MTMTRESSAMAAILYSCTVTEFTITSSITRSIVAFSFAIRTIFTTSATAHASLSCSIAVNALLIAFAGIA